MGQIQASERRRSGRENLTGALPGAIKIKGDEDPLHVKPIDVSDQGLGVLMDRPLRPGTEVIIDGLDTELEFEVVWYKKESNGGPETYHHGLLLKSRDINLIELFRAAGAFADGG